jgi:serine/threonine protein kinase
MRECPKCGTCYEDAILKCQFHEADTKQVLPGSQKLAGRYFLERRLGRGAMGQVYLARDENLGTRQVAVKTVRPDLLTNEDLQEGEAIARFEREARAAASIRHPNVVDVTDFGKSSEGVFYLVMEYVKGETLHDLLRREGTLAAKRALDLLKQIGAGVEAAHEAGILHRDLKPANIFLLKTGRKSDDGFIKVGDFGLAKIVGDAQAEISAKQGPASRGIIGTPEFMAPEQMHSERPIDGRADTYALGTIAYMMLGGKVPYTGDLMQIISSKMTQPPPTLSKLRTDIAPEIERAIMHALENAPDKRPATVSDWLDELSAAVEKSGRTPERTEHSGRVIIMAPVGAEVYVDDERKGSVGSSGRVILSSVPPGRHILRVSQRGSRDDERVIEIREDSAEQVIQAALKPENAVSTSHQSGSQANKSVPEVVVCLNCNSRYAAGIRFCGKCGGSRFQMLHGGGSIPPVNPSIPPSQPHRFTVSTDSQQPPTSASFNCPRCSRVLPLNAKFCGGCGLQLTAPLPNSQQQPNFNSQNAGNFFGQNPPQRQPEVKCRVCGSIYTGGTRFCGKCGNPI